MVSTVRRITVQFRRIAVVVMVPGWLFSCTLTVVDGGVDMYVLPYVVMVRFGKCIRFLQREQRAEGNSIMKRADRE
jgi:membrane protein YqaA with SNARE-associated domain